MEISIIKIPATRQNIQAIKNSKRVQYGSLGDKRTEIIKSYLRHSMLKKGVIFFFLATAYTVLLAHNFTPHQHNIEQTTHHHGHDHHHDDHDDDNQKNAFHFFQHIGAPGIEFISAQFIKYDHKKKWHETAFLNLTNAFLSDFEKPPLLVPIIQSGQLFIQQTMPHFFPIKAPPTYIA